MLDNDDLSCSIIIGSILLFDGLHYIPFLPQCTLQTTVYGFLNNQSDF